MGISSVSAAVPEGVASVLMLDEEIGSDEVTSGRYDRIYRTAANVKT